MSFGSSQGTVRYALMVDDAQAQKAITTFKTNVTGLAAPTITASRNMGTLNQQFAAGVNPIKAQGNALTTLNTNLKTTQTTSTTLGTKIKSTAGQFAGFATGLSATTTSVLQLAAGFRDYGDAQIAVDKVTRKLSLATEVQGKAQDKLKKLTDSGIKSGKAFAAAQLDVEQANAAVSIQTDLLGEAQERMFDSQTQFVASVVPTVLGAFGTMGFAFKEFGLSTEKMTSGLGKLKGGLSSISGSLGMSSKAFLGMGAAIGVAAIAALDLFDLLQQKQKLIELDIPINAGTATIKNLEDKIAFVKELKARWDIQMTDFFKSGPIGKATLGETTAKIGDEVIKSLESAISRMEASKPLERLFEMITKSPLPPTAKANIQTQIKHILDIYNNDTNWQNPEFTKTSQGIVNNLITTLGSSIKSADVTAGLTGALRTMFVKIFKGVEFGNSPMTQLFAIDPKPIAASLDPIGKLYKATMDKIVAAGKPRATFMQLFGDKTKVVTAAMEKYNATHIPAVTGMTAFQAALNKGNTDFNTFVETTKNGVITADAYRERLVSWATQEGIVANANKLTTAELELQIKAVEGDEDAIKSLAETSKRKIDELKKKMEELGNSAQSGLDKIVEAFHKTNKKGKLDFEMDFKRADKKFQEFMGDVAKKFDKGGTEGAKNFVEGFAKKAQSKLKGESKRIFDPLQQFVKDHKDDAPDVWFTGFLDFIQKQSPSIYDTLATNQLPTKSQMEQLASGNANTYLTSTKNTISGSEPIQIPAEVKWAGFGSGGGLDFGEKEFKIPAPTIDIAPATKSIDRLIGNFNGFVSLVEKTNPKALLDISTVTKSITRLIGNFDGWVQLAKKTNPKALLDITGATKSITRLIGNFNGYVSRVEKANPKVKIDITGAVKSIDRLIGDLNGIPNITRTVTIKENKVSAQGGFHTNRLQEDTVIFAHKGESAHVGPGRGAVHGGGFGGGSSGSETIIENNFTINVLDETIMKRITSRSGRNRFTLGV